MYRSNITHMLRAERVPLKSKASPFPRLPFLAVFHKSAVERMIVRIHTIYGKTLEPLSFNECVKNKNTKAMIYKNTEDKIL